MPHGPREVRERRSVMSSGHTLMAAMGGLMPYWHVLQSGRWVLVASVFFAACAGVPGRGAPDRYEQSFDSATSACRQNPALCARMAGEEMGQIP